MSAATGWDRGGVYYADPLNAHEHNQTSISEADIERRCGKFLEHFRIDNQFIYRYYNMLNRLVISFVAMLPTGKIISLLSYRTFNLTMNKLPLV